MPYNLSNSYPPPAAHGVRLLLSSFYSPSDKALCPLPRPSPQPLPGRPAHPRSRGRRRRPAGGLGNRAYQARSLRATYWSKRRVSSVLDELNHTVGEARIQLHPRVSGLEVGRCARRPRLQCTKTGLEVQGLVSIQQLGGVACARQASERDVVTSTMQSPFGWLCIAGWNGTMIRPSLDGTAR